MTYVAMAFIVMTYVVIAYISKPMYSWPIQYVSGLYRCSLHSYTLHSYDRYIYGIIVVYYPCIWCLYTYDTYNCGLGVASVVTICIVLACRSTAYTGTVEKVMAYLLMAYAVMT